MSVTKVSRILVSQPQPAVPEKSPFYELARRHHITVDYHPFIRVAGVSLKEFRQQRVEILDHTAVIFTSRTTVDSFFRICEEARVTVPETMKYICQTEAVALYLQKYIVYRKRKISFADGSFTNLIELLIKHKDEKFLLTLSEPHKPDLPETMAKLKFSFHPVILARTVATDPAGTDIRDYDVVGIYSPSEVKVLIEQFGSDLPTIARLRRGDAALRYRGGADGQNQGPDARSSVDGQGHRHLCGSGACRQGGRNGADRRGQAEGGVHPLAAAQAGQEKPRAPHRRRQEIVSHVPVHEEPMNPSRTLPRTERLRTLGAIRRLFDSGESGFVYPFRYVWFAEARRPHVGRSALLRP